MTGEPMHSASNERMAPDLMSLSEYVSQISINKHINEVTITLHFKL